MASYSNFQSENKKHTADRTNIFNPSFNSTVDAKGDRSSFHDNIDKYVEFLSWARWNPDLFLDLITPETGGIRLDLDQRVFIRVLSRFVSTYAVFPRGYGKTMIEVLSMYVVAVLYPNIELTMTAQTREQAMKLVQEKHQEIVRYYPLLAAEITSAKFNKDTARIEFASGSIVDVLANSNSSKGSRRRRMMVEESALLNNELFQDALEPIVNVPRRTMQGNVDPQELNGQINFLTTAGYRNSDEYMRSLIMVEDMANLRGKMVLGADFQLACAYGRGEPISKLLDKKATLSPIFFKMNYGSSWTGATDGAMVDINTLMELRTLGDAELKGDGKGEYIMAVDVARSEDTSNNQSSVAILKITRNKNGKVSQINAVNLINVSNALSFTQQAIEVKKIQRLYGAKVCIVDTNGLGKPICPFMQ